MRCFQFAHISDLHLCEPNNQDLLEDIINGFARPGDIAAAREVAQFVERELENLDAVLLSGDLAHSGQGFDLEVALSFVSSEPRLSQPTLQGCGKRLLLFPGNHDRFKGRLRRPGAVTFDQLFIDYWSAGQGVQVFELRGARERDESLAVVCADFSLRTDEFFVHWGHGRAYQDLVDDLKVRSMEASRRKSAVIWAIHFPPGDEIDDKHIRKSLRLKEWERLTAAAMECGVRCIFSGHIHDSIAYRIVNEIGSVDVFCAGSACVREETRSMSLVTVRVESGHVTAVDFLPFFFGGSGVRKGKSFLRQFGAPA